MREEPGLSLRRVAERAGISVGTALDVRRRVGAGARPEAGAPMPDVEASTDADRVGEVTAGDGVVVGLWSRAPEPRPVASLRELRHTLDRLARDPSWRTDHGRALLRVVATTLSFDERADDLAKVTPAHSRDALAGIAQSCAAAWTEFGERLTGKAEPTRQAG
jgi:hypothetical protein